MDRIHIEATVQDLQSDNKSLHQLVLFVKSFVSGPNPFIVASNAATTY